MRVLAYTCPWPADHPKSDECFSDLKLAAYAVPYSPAILGYSKKFFWVFIKCILGRHIGKYYLQKQVEFLRTSIHWKKAYFYLWDEPLNIEHYDSLLNMAKEIHAYAPDAHILTTYYGGPTDAPLAPTPFEAFVKVPKFPHPHNQIYCTSEWVLGNREDLIKNITAELQPENGEIKFRRGLPAGDGVLYYPGQVFSSSNVPVASLRLERILSGLQDIEYLKTLHIKVW